MTHPLQDLPRLTTRIEDVLANYERGFDGAPWLVVEEMVYPNQEVTFIAAVPTTAVHNSNMQARIVFSLAQTPDGNIVELGLELPDRDCPLFVSSWLNPVTDQVRSWLSTLANQSALTVHFFDQDDGESILARRFPLDREYREAASKILAMTAGASADLASWDRAVAAMREIAPDHFSIIPSEQPEPKVGRNELCPCQKQPRRKFKHCCGA